MSQAYEILNDPSSRREYDNYLSQQEGPATIDNEGERMVASMIGVGKETKSASLPYSRKTPAAKAATPSRNKKAEPKRVRPVERQEAVEEDNRVERMLESVDTISGPVLKKTRTMLGISLDDLSERTKIRKTYLQYLEDEEYEFLPAPVYIKGFVSNIASCLGLPTQRAADEYMEAYRSQQDGE